MAMIRFATLAVVSLLLIEARRGECSRVKATKRSLLPENETVEPLLQDDGVPAHSPLSPAVGDERPDASCGSLMATYVATSLVPLPFTGVPAGAVLLTCCPTWAYQKLMKLKAKYSALKEEAKEKAKPELQKFVDNIQAQTNDDERAEQRFRDSILETYNLKGLLAVEKQRLEDEHPWLVYPKLVELYRFWPIDLPGLNPGSPCSEKLEQKLIEMREQYDFLPGLSGGRQVSVNGSMVSASPIPDALNDQMPLSDNATTVKKPSIRQRFCKKIASGFEYVANQMGTKMTMDTEEANAYRMKFCNWA